MRSPSSTSTTNLGDKLASRATAGRHRGLEGRRQVLHGPGVPQGRRHVVRQEPDRGAADDDGRAARRRQGRLDQARLRRKASTTSSAGRRLRRRADGRHRQVHRRHGGFAEAFAYLKELKDAGAGLRHRRQPRQPSSRPARSTRSSTAHGRRPATGRRSATTSPSRRSRMARRAAANPFTGIDGWYINPNSDRAPTLAVDVALAMVKPENEQVFVDDAGHVPANPTVGITDPITPGLRRRRRGGSPTQNAAVRQLVGPFGNALNQVVDTGADPATGHRQRVRRHEQGERHLAVLDRDRTPGARALPSGIIDSRPRARSLASEPDPRPTLAVDATSTFTRSGSLDGDRRRDAAPPQPGGSGPTRERGRYIYLFPAFRSWASSRSTRCSSRSGCRSPTSA